MTTTSATRKRKRPPATKAPAPAQRRTPRKAEANAEAVRQSQGLNAATEASIQTYELVRKIGNNASAARLKSYYREVKQASETNMVSGEGKLGPNPQYLYAFVPKFIQELERQAHILDYRISEKSVERFLEGPQRPWPLCWLLKQPKQNAGGLILEAWQCYNTQRWNTDKPPNSKRPMLRNWNAERVNLISALLLNPNDCPQEYLETGLTLRPRESGFHRKMKLDLLELLPNMEKSADRPLVSEGFDPYRLVPSQRHPAGYHHYVDQATRNRKLHRSPTSRVLADPRRIQ